MAGPKFLLYSSGHEALNTNKDACHNTHNASYSDNSSSSRHVGHLLALKQKGLLETPLLEDMMFLQGGLCRQHTMPMTL